MVDEDEALCAILAKKLGKKGREGECIAVVKEFIKHKDFDKTMEELSKLLEIDKDKLAYLIGNTCIPCEHPEVIERYKKEEASSP